MVKSKEAMRKAFEQQRVRAASSKPKRCPTDRFFDHEPSPATCQNEGDEAKVAELLRGVKEAEDMLRFHILQGKKNDRGNFAVAIDGEKAARMDSHAQVGRWRRTLSLQRLPWCIGLTLEARSMRGAGAGGKRSCADAGRGACSLVHLPRGQSCS